MGKRSIAQLILLALGMAAWGYGFRVDMSAARWVGIGFFAAAAVLGAFRHRKGDSGR